ncbi:hypothetical protein O3M35_002751 [Rhynocoris fuscipes]|uniref:Bee-milk protein n=1 Tax=Rhynocoris fuscipes TaxID=488301 RepID=A0AAW1CU21_9HEMI
MKLPPFGYCNFTRELVCSMSLYPNGLFIGWDSNKQKRDYIKKGWYSPRNILPTRFQMVNDTVFLAIPRFRCGVPFSLGFVQLNDYCKAEPIMHPYPSWGINKAEEGHAGIVSAVDLQIDNNLILWVLDVGIIDTLTQPKFIAPPKIVGFCLNTGKMKFNFNLLELVNEHSRLQYIQVEVTGSKTYLYVSDAGTNSLIVWDTARSHAFKVQLPPQIMEGCNSDKADVLYIALLQMQCSKKSLYFTYLNSQSMYHVDTHRLRGQAWHGVVESDGQKPGRIVILGTDRYETMFFRLRGSPDVFLWNAMNEFRPENLYLAESIEGGRLPTHVTLGGKGLIWSLESNFPDFLGPPDKQCNAIGPSVKIHPIVRFCDEYMNATTAIKHEKRWCSNQKK